MMCSCVGVMWYDVLGVAAVWEGLERGRSGVGRCGSDVV